ncbi:MAG: winged helix-turn-helix domain-containing protein [Anaerolineae bacterium]
MEVKSNIWVEVDGEVALSRWRVSLLEAVQETGSISKAAEKMGVSYHRAWDKIRECEERLGVKLLETQIGGSGGGGAKLTRAGQQYVERFKAFSAGIDSQIRQRFEAVFVENS